MDIRERTETKLSTHLFDFSIFFESKLVVIVDIREFLFGKIDTSFRDIVHLPFLLPMIEVVDNSIETSGSNFTRVIH